MEIASTAVLSIHFLAVDVAMAAPLACVWLTWRERRLGDSLAGKLNLRMAMASIVALAVAMVFGALQIGILSLSNDRDFWRAVHLIPTSRLWFALGELIFFFLTMAFYVWLSRRTKQRPIWQTLVALLAASNLMYHFPPLFVILSRLAERAELAAQPLDSALYRQLLLDPEVMAMVLHIWLAAIAVSAVVVLVWALKLKSASESINLTIGAARWALLATLAQLPVGICVMVATSNHTRNSLLGDDAMGAGLFGLGILTALVLLHHLAPLTFSEANPSLARRAALLTIATVVLMTAALDRVRWVHRQEAARYQSSSTRESMLSSCSSSGGSTGNRCSSFSQRPRSI